MKFTTTTLISYWIMTAGLFVILLGEEWKHWIFAIGLVIVGGVIYIVDALDEYNKRFR